MSVSQGAKESVGAGLREARYQVIYKKGDDLRQDQVVVQIFSLMDRLLKRENLDLRLTPYRCVTALAITACVCSISVRTLKSIEAHGRDKGQQPLRPNASYTVPY
jgi:phosphatidylinositol 3-kinase